ncbi:MAG: tRNA lysidine(34) synthetase TilS [Oceanospirillaceae bacterium]|nr:tRNA lysidine(34) synthetase TilS [Oceanospirillaceae bacterium]
MPDQKLQALFNERLQASAFASRRWVIAFSGGLDSTVLLHLCAQAVPPQSLRAIHVDHGLQDSSHQWATHCRAVCEALGVACQVVAVKPVNASEASARDARYAVFESLIEANDCLLMAHHADDQAETLLFRLLRGAGVVGLSAMPVRRSLGAGELYRPLLDQPRSLLEQWAQQQGLVWVEDPSNQREDYERNWLRHRILTPLCERWPNAASRLAKTAAQLSDTAVLLEEYAADELKRLGHGADWLDLEQVGRLSQARLNNLLRYWVYTCCGHRLSARELESLNQDLLRAGADRMPTLKVGPFILRRYRQRLYITPLHERVSDPLTLTTEEASWKLKQGVLAMIPAQKAGIASDEAVELRYRRDGDRLRPLGRGGSVSLKQLFQEAGVPPWQRNSWPLLCRNDEIIAVPGICICEKAAVSPGLQPIWRPFGLSEGGGFDRL